MQEKRQEKSPIKQNILLYLAQKGVSPYEFYKESGVTRGILQQNNGISEDNIARFLAYAPDISVEWLITGRGEMLSTMQEKSDSEEKLPKVSYNPAIGKPYYDVDFLGGFNEIVNSQVTIPTNNIVIQGFEKADFWCNVTGHSMEPKINHGDIIALHKCTLEDIQYGEIYAVPTRRSSDLTLSYLIHYAPSRYSVGRQIQRSCVSCLSIRQTMTSKNIR